MAIGMRRTAPVLVDGDGEGARNGEGERETEVKSTPSVRERADWAGREPVGDEE